MTFLKFTLNISPKAWNEQFRSAEHYFCAIILREAFSEHRIIFKQQVDEGWVWYKINVYI